MIKALIFLLDTLSRLYLLILLMRFWLPALRANFQNPIAQGVLRYTSPLIIPVRRFVPSLGRLDTATVLVAYAIQLAVLIVISGLVNIGRGANPMAALSDADSIMALALSAFLELAMLSVMLFIVVIIIRIILNLLGRYLGPISDMLADLSDPMLKPIRRVIPPLGIVDLSAYVALILLIALNIALNDLLPGAR